MCLTSTFSLNQTLWNTNTLLCWKLTVESGFLAKLHLLPRSREVKNPATRHYKVVLYTLSVAGVLTSLGQRQKEELHRLTVGNKRSVNKKTDRNTEKQKVREVSRSVYTEAKLSFIQSNVYDQWTTACEVNSHTYTASWCNVSVLRLNIF